MGGWRVLKAEGRHNDTSAPRFNHFQPQILELMLLQGNRAAVLDALSPLDAAASSSDPNAVAGGEVCARVWPAGRSWMGGGGRVCKARVCGGYTLGGREERCVHVPGWREGWGQRVVHGQGVRRVYPRRAGG